MPKSIFFEEGGGDSDLKDLKVSKTRQPSAGDTDCNDCLTFWKVKGRRRTKIDI